MANTKFDSFKLSGNNQVYDIDLPRDTDLRIRSGTFDDLLLVAKNIGEGDLEQGINIDFNSIDCYNKSFTEPILYSLGVNSALFNVPIKIGIRGSGTGISTTYSLEDYIKKIHNENTTAPTLVSHQLNFISSRNGETSGSLLTPIIDNVNIPIDLTNYTTRLTFSGSTSVDLGPSIFSGPLSFPGSSHLSDSALSDTCRPLYIFFSTKLTKVSSGTFEVLVEGTGFRLWLYPIKISNAQLIQNNRAVSASYIVGFDEASGITEYSIDSSFTERDYFIIKDNYHKIS